MIIRPCVRGMLGNGIKRLYGNCQMALQLARLCFDKLNTNGKNLTKTRLTPFALSLSKGERRRAVASGEALN